MKTTHSSHYTPAKQIPFAQGKFLHLERGSPLPMGPTKLNAHINFALYAKYASEVVLSFFERGERNPFVEIHLDAKENRTGDVWHISIEGIPPETLYAYRITAPWQAEHLATSDSHTYLLDPYAKAVCLRPEIEAGDSELSPHFDYRPLGVLDIPEVDGWEYDRPLSLPKEDAITYEMHIRGFTQDSSSEVAHPGTFLGVIEKIPYLKEIGINAVELLPVWEFNAFEAERCVLPHSGPLGNYWGYNPVSFFAPMNRYASSQELGAAVRDFKKMVMALHEAGIEVILDIVLNHTGEGNEKGPTISLKGIDPKTYFILDSHGRHTNYTGCGNTVNCNHPVVKQLILDCLRYWVMEMHVDGFRFDLASILTRDRKGQPLPNSPLVEAIADDPILAQTKLIAEPWDAGGLYQVGNFYPHSRRWCEWNGKFRDDVRDYIKGSPGKSGTFATRICGSQDLYSYGSPLMTVNFITAHDGFTLRDLVSYNYKHNMMNGENNRDGADSNHSWNCGEEGETDDPKVLLLRQKQMRNLHLALMISQGIPMLQMGDEYGHTKLGNNNTWCQDNDLSWFDWSQIHVYQNFFRFFKKVNHFRDEEPLLKNGHFLTNEDIIWHGVIPKHPDWGSKSHFLAFTLVDRLHGKNLYIAFNPYHQQQKCQLPDPEQGHQWHWVVNTANPSPEDFYDKAKRPVVFEREVTLEAYSAIVLKA